MLSLIKIFVSALICIVSTTILHAEEANTDLVSAHGIFVFNNSLFLESPSIKVIFSSKSKPFFSNNDFNLERVILELFISESIINIL